MSVRVLKSKWRGLDDAMKRLGDITGEIDRRLADGKRVAVLEIGCGNGMALLDLSCLYGDRVSLHGINKLPRHGQTEATKDIAIQLGRRTAAELQGAPAPVIHHFDASDPWPLADDAFDVVFSQHSFLWIADKVRALEEANRVLKGDGIALFDLQFQRRGGAQKSSIIIKDGTRETAFWDHAQKHMNILAHMQEDAKGPAMARFRAWALRLVGRKNAAARRGRAKSALGKAPGLDFGLEFCTAGPFGKEPGRKGLQSVYRFRGAA